MSEKSLIILLKTAIVIGILLLVCGHYLLTSEELKAQLGIYSYMVSAACIALGIVFSLPTKMYLTILLMKNEEQRKTVDAKQDR